MKLSRDLSGTDLVKALGRIGYRVTRQTGSHIRLTLDSSTQHHVTIPAHVPLKLGTLAAILGDVAAHQEISRDVLLDRPFDRGSCMGALGHLQPFGLDSPFPRNKVVSANLSPFDDTASDGYVRCAGNNATVQLMMSPRSRSGACALGRL